MSDERFYHYETGELLFVDLGLALDDPVGMQIELGLDSNQLVSIDGLRRTFIVKDMKKYPKINEVEYQLQPAEEIGDKNEK